jgi:hypothetical protein
VERIVGAFLHHQEVCEPTGKEGTRSSLMDVDPICLHSVGKQQYPTARLRAAPAAMAAVALAVKHLLLLLGQQLITHLLLLLLFVRVCAGAG